MFSAVNSSEFNFWVVAIFLGGFDKLRLSIFAMSTYPVNKVSNVRCNKGMISYFKLTPWRIK